jgi:hypothetical protein
MRQIISTTGLAALSLIAGCSTYSGAVQRASNWPSATSNLGRTAILVTRPPFQNMPKELRQNLEREARVTVIDSQPVLDGLKADETPDAVSDVTLIEAARKTNADTVMLVSVNECKWGFGVLPPSIWYGTLRYQLRVLDVQTGRMLLVANRACTVPGMSLQEFCRKTPEFVSRDITQITATTKPAA